MSNKDLKFIFERMGVKRKAKKGTECTKLGSDFFEGMEKPGLQSTSPKEVLRPKE